MKYRDNLKYHFKPQSGWINDPNGLVYFRGKYHVFYQHAPMREVSDRPIHWGHTATTDFINWEQLPIALYPDREYDDGGCWSGTAIVKDDVLYLFYAGSHTPAGADRQTESVCVAYSKDGINFEKYEGNPVIPGFPKDGGPDFRDPAVTQKDGKYYLVMATGNEAAGAARLLLYESEDLFNWNYKGIMSEWKGFKFAECPSFMPYKDKCLLTASVYGNAENHFFSIKYGDFDGKNFAEKLSCSIDRGPDQYAGQAFLDGKGRAILMSWIPGWSWGGVLGKDIGCLSVPKEITVKDGKVFCYPIEELCYLLKESDDAVEITDNGFIIHRGMRDDVVYEGEIKDLKILRDDYIIEVFVNGGEIVYTAVLL